MSSHAQTDTDTAASPDAEPSTAAAQPTSCSSGGAGCGACSLSGGGCGSGEQAAAAEPTAPVGCGAAAAQAPEPTWNDTASTKLSGVPAFVWALVVTVLVVTGAVLGTAFGAVLFGLGVLVVAGLAAVSWPRLDVSAKAIRVAVLVFLLGVAVIRFVPA